MPDWHARCGIANVFLIKGPSLRAPNQMMKPPLLLIAWFGAWHFV